MMKRLMILTLAFAASMFGATRQVTAEPLVALAQPAMGASALLRFDSATPRQFTSTNITGLQAGEFLGGIDY